MDLHNETLHTPPTDSKKVFQCSECNRAYSRVDHLARHVRSHTREKPYRCEICSKAFARGDLLKRHTAAHQRRYDERGQYGSEGSDRISRVAKACKTCSMMHLRCDEDKPCGRCRKKNIPCEWVEEPFPQASAGAPMQFVPVQGPAGSQIDDVAAAEDLLRLSDNQGSLPNGPNGAPMSYSVPAGTNDFMRAVSFQPQGQSAQTTDSMGEHMRQQLAEQYTRKEMAEQAGHGQSIQIRQNQAAPLMDPSFNSVMSYTMPSEALFPWATQPNAWPNRSLFDFGGMDSAYDFGNMDFSFLNTYNEDIPFMPFENPAPKDPILPPSVPTASRPAVALGLDAYRQSSVWRWKPNAEDKTSRPHQDLNLPVSTIPRNISALGGRKSEDKFDAATRDKVLALVISHCSGESWTVLPPWQRWTSSFPNVELLDALVQFCLSAPIAQCDHVFHMPTFSVREMTPELVLTLVAFGAILAPDTNLNKLGMALQEIVRQALPRAWESDNTLTRDIQLAQAYQLQQGIGFWSGDSRKTELSEAFSGPAITMLRRGNRFRRSQYPYPAVEANDECEALENKWKSWIEAESWKRIVYIAASNDSKQSWVFFTAPLVSYAELALPLPDAREIWLASSALAWKTAYLAKVQLNPSRRPSLLDFLSNVSSLTSWRSIIDIHFSSMTVIGGIWHLIWEYWQQKALTKLSMRERQAVLSQWKFDELKQTLSDFRGCDHVLWAGNETIHLLIELLSLHLHIPLEEVQVFAGIDGPEEAQRVLPELREWSMTQQAREAVWHAGQVIRIAKATPKATLVAFKAVAVYQAALAFWTYGLIVQSSHPLQNSNDLLWLDEPETIGRAEFIGQNLHRPCIRGLSDPKQPSAAAPLDKPGDVLSIIIHIFESNFDVAGVSRPIVVENLLQLMAGLRTATERFARRRV